jgi:integrase
MRAWVYQAANQLSVHGAKKAPWSVGWYDQRGKKKQKTIGTKTAANQYARKLEGEAAAGLLRSHERIRWADFVARFKRDHLATLAPTSGPLYERAITEFTTIIGPQYLDQVDEGAIAEFRAKRMKDVKSPATVNKDLRFLRCALNKARKWKLIPQRIEFDMLREPERDPYFVDDETFGKLYRACSEMTQPTLQHCEASEWWQALLTFCYMTGWRIGEALSLRRDYIDWANGVATIPADVTKGKRDARIELHPVVISHLKTVVGFGPMVFEWPLHERLLWTHFAKLKKAAKVEFDGAFHRFRFGFANANVDSLEPDVLQRLMRHQDAKTTRHYVNTAERMKRRGTADRLHVPEILAKKA